MLNPSSILKSALKRKITSESPSRELHHLAEKATRQTAGILSHNEIATKYQSHRLGHKRHSAAFQKWPPQSVSPAGTATKLALLDSRQLLTHQKGFKNLSSQRKTQQIVPYTGNEKQKKANLERRDWTKVRVSPFFCFTDNTKPEGFEQKITAYIDGEATKQFSYAGRNSLFRDEAWISCPAGQARLFLFETFHSSYKLLTINPVTEQTRTVAAGETGELRLDTCLANFKDKFIFIIGGRQAKKCHKLVSRFNIDRLRCQKMPQLNESRRMASSCSLGQYVYVFFGFNERKAVVTIEKLVNPDKAPNTKGQSWKLIEPQAKEGILALQSVMASFLVTPLNSSEIVIFRRDHTLIFKSKTQEIEKDIGEQLFEFKASGSQAVQVSKNKVVSLVEVDTFFSSILCLVEFQKSKGFNIIHSFGEEQYADKPPCYRKHHSIVYFQDSSESSESFESSESVDSEKSVCLCVLNKPCRVHESEEIDSDSKESPREDGSWSLDSDKELVFWYRSGTSYVSHKILHPEDTDVPLPYDERDSYEQ